MQTIVFGAESSETVFQFSFWQRPYTAIQTQLFIYMGPTGVVRGSFLFNRVQHDELIHWSGRIKGVFSPSLPYILFLSFIILHQSIMIRSQFGITGHRSQSRAPFAAKLLNNKSPLINLSIKHQTESWHVHLVYPPQSQQLPNNKKPKRAWSIEGEECIIKEKKSLTGVLTDRMLFLFFLRLTELVKLADDGLYKTVLGRHVPPPDGHLDGILTALRVCSSSSQLLERARPDMSSRWALSQNTDLHCCWSNKD